MSITGIGDSRRATLKRLLGAASAAAIAGAFISVPAYAQDSAPAQPDKASASALVETGAASAAAAQPAPGATGDSATAAAQQQQSQGQDQAIVITGFRRSLQQALNIKRQSTSEVDAIVARTLPSSPTRTSPRRSSAFPASRSPAQAARAIRSRSVDSIRNSRRSGSMVSRRSRPRPRTRPPIATARSTSTSSPPSFSGRWSSTRPPKPRSMKDRWARSWTSTRAVPSPTTPD